MKKALRKTVDRLRLRRCRAQSAGCGEGPLLEKREKWRTPQLVQVASIYRTDCVYGVGR